jgi:hypothetical protein
VHLLLEQQREAADARGDNDFAQTLNAGKRPGMAP